MDINYMHPAEQICVIMKRIYQRQMTTLSGGNLSVMDADGIMWVSPSGVDKASLSAEDIVQVHPDGSCNGKYKPTSEYLIHLEIYKSSPAVKAILHAHPPAMTAMSTLHAVPDTTLYPMSHRLNGDASIAIYGLPGSMQLAHRVAQVFKKGSQTAVLENHGVFLGSTEDIFQAFRRFEELEATAHIQMMASVLGTPKGADLKLLGTYEDSVSRPPQAKDVYSCTSWEKDLRSQLSGISQRAYGNGMFTAVQGVVSARVEGDTFLISPRDRDNAYITPGEFVTVTEGQYGGQRLPDESMELHQRIYQSHPEIQALILATPPYAMMFGVTQEEYSVAFIPECYGVLRSCRRYPFSEILNKGIELAGQISGDDPFALVENYGVLMAGSSILTAYDRLEVCENTGKSIHMAKMTGRPIMWMTQKQLEEMDGK